MVRETMALRAVVEPRLISEMTTPERKETRIALRGMGRLGGICLYIRRSELESEKPSTHLGQEGRERQPAVPRKRPDLPRGGGDLADHGTDERDDDDGDHDVRTGEAFGGIVEELDEWVFCR